MKVGSRFIEGFGFSTTLNDSDDSIAISDGYGKHFLDGDRGGFAGFDAFKEGHVFNLRHVVMDLWFFVIDRLSCEGVAIGGETDSCFEECFGIQEAQGRTVRTAY